VLLAVVHVLDVPQMLANVAVARTAGCDGVFLVNHDPGVSDIELAGPFVHAVAAEHPGFFCGVNCLGLDTPDAFTAAGLSAPYPDGLWCDDAGIDERRDVQDKPDAIDGSRTRSPFSGLYFGGVAFKYQRPVDDIEAAARLAASYVDVVTTSGAGTGSAPDAAKLALMRRALGDHPFAVASGVTPDNADTLAVHVDAVLAATGIASNFHTLDPVLARDLADVVHGL
jgi:hypothetical protein